MTQFINLEQSDALKTHDLQCGWINLRLMSAFQDFLKLHSHISVFWGFRRISVISEFSFLGIGLKTKTRKSRKTFSFGSTKLKWIWTVFRSLFQLS